MNNTHVLKSKIADTKTAVESRLFLGEDTQSLRTTLAELEAQLADAERKESSEERARQQAEAEQADQRAAETIDAAHQAVLANTGSDVIADVQMPAIDVDPAIANAAARLSAARHRLERENAVYAEHRDKHLKLEGRLSDKERARDAILARRLSGDEKPGDAAEVALLAEDIGSLKELATDARRNAEQYRPVAARRMVEDAEKALAEAQARAVFNAKEARVQELERAFIQAHEELVAAGAAIGSKNRFALFKASQELRRIVIGTTY